MENTEKLEKQISQLKEEERILKARIARDEGKLANAERKARTKRLIAIGAEVEHYAGCQITDLDAFKTYLAKYGKFIAKTQQKKK